MIQQDTMLRAFGGFGAWELILILIIVLLIFGAGKLPQIGDALGRGIRNFKSASKGEDNAPVDVTPKAIEGKSETAQTVEVESHVEQQKA